MGDRHDFRLNFRTDRNEIFRITIPRARTTATHFQVNDAMEEVILSGVVNTARGLPTALHSAELVTASRQEYSVPA